MIGLKVTDGARASFRGWRLGLLAVEGLLPRGDGSALENEVGRIEEELKDRFDGHSRKEMARLEPTRHYVDHFSSAGKAYPVLLQAESVASKGRRIAMADPLVRAMFAAELEGMLLTAGHDSTALLPPLSLGISSGTETMPTFGGIEKTPPEGDLILRDAAGIVASVLLGPDARTALAPTSSRALFVVYAPAEIPAEGLRAYLGRLYSLTILACPEAGASESEVFEL